MDILIDFLYAFQIRIISKVSVVAISEIFSIIQNTIESLPFH